MRTEDFNYNLPEELIAQHPLEKRDDSRLLLLNKESGDIEHKKFSDIVDYLKEGDLLVVNNTRVLPARVYGSRLGKDEKIEFLLIKEVRPDVWETMVRPGKKARIGHKIEFGNGLLLGEIVGITEEGTRLIEFEYDGIFIEKLEKLGEMPIPPYIHEKLENQERYQTVYSKNLGSAAAPTAGLHFTDELLDQIRDIGVQIAYVTLHVGLGTFSPVRVDDIKDHKMHSEYYSIDEENAKMINKAVDEGRRIIAVGTTSCRTLESAADSRGYVKAGKAWTDIFIYPGYEFKLVDHLITNFHLPESTLLMLISALAGKDKIFKAYEEAVREKYRFFSFGDAMLIL